MREFGLLLDPDWWFFIRFFYLVFLCFFVFVSFFGLVFCFVLFSGVCFGFYLSLTSSYLLWVLRNRDHSWKLTTYIQSYFALGSLN